MNRSWSRPLSALLVSLALAACGGFSIDRSDQASGAPSGAAVEVGPSFSYTAWSERDDPEYYRVIGPAQLADIPEPGTATYSPLDRHGRAGQAAACVTFEMMEAGRSRERDDMSSVHPSGWGHNDEVDIELADGSFYHGRFWNRSHLIAKSLGGSDEIENLVTGTRMQNVGSNTGDPGGMAYCEDLARDWLDAHPTGSIAYVATPVYEGTEPVCRSVIVDLRSSDGLVDQRVEVFNTAKGYEVDYAEGSFRKLP